MANESFIQKISRYELESKLGEGGMGTVYKAMDPVLGRYVALKVARLKTIGIDGSNSRIMDKCLREARVAAQFIHPNIAITYDAGFENDFFYMALEYIDGVGLQKYTSPSNLLPRIQVLEIIFTICYSLDFIHQSGLIHLDIKPSNIMMSRKGEIKLMDFGISRFFRDKPSEEASKTWVGSPHYMSPEQTNPKQRLNCRSDIFSLGVVLYHLLSGHRPFTGDNPMQIFYKILNEEPEPIEHLVPDISPALARTVKTAMSKNVENRFQTAVDFADSLQEIIKGKDSRALSEQDTQKIDYLKKVIFFQHFQYSDLKEILKISTWTFHQKNEWIVDSSDSQTNIYFIITGRASLHIAGDIKMLKKGDCVGETAVLYRMSRNIKIKAETNCIVMTVNANILNQSNPSLQVKFIKEFYKNKTLQLVEANLKMIQMGRL